MSQLRFFCLKLAAACLCLAPFSMSPALAKAAVSPQPVATSATYGNWVLRCAVLGIDTIKQAKQSDAVTGTKKSCEVFQSIRAQGQPNPIAELAIGYLSNDTKTLVMTAVLPVNISFPGMVEVSGNGKTGADEKGKIALTWKRCVDGACFASVKLDVAEFKILRAGSVGQLRFANANGRIVTVPISWRGLEEAALALAGQK